MEKKKGRVRLGEQVKSDMQRPEVRAQNECAQLLMTKRSEETHGCLLEALMFVAFCCMYLLTGENIFTCQIPLFWADSR
jgi:hypothetical protein